MISSGRTSKLTPVIFFVIGAGLGGFLGAEALSYGALWFFAVFVATPAAALAIRAWRGASRRLWRDTAGFVLGAGALGCLFAVPQLIAFGGSGPIIPAGVYIALLLLGVGILVGSNTGRLPVRQQGH